MFNFAFKNEQIRFMLSDRTAFWDAQIEEELTPALKQLKETGEIAGANCGQKPGIAGLVYELKGLSFPAHLHGRCCAEGSKILRISASVSFH